MHRFSLKPNSEYENSLLTGPPFFPQVSVGLSACLSVFFSACLYVCLSIRRSACLSIDHSVSPFVQNDSFEMIEKIFMMIKLGSLGRKTSYMTETGRHTRLYESFS